MDRTLDLLLRNLRAEITRMDKQNKDYAIRIANQEKELLKLRQQAQIDECTGIMPMFAACDCGRVPTPGAVIKVTEPGLYECPKCLRERSFKR